MEYGFDDTLFEESSCLSGAAGRTCTYAPKQCEPEWFFGGQSTCGSDGVGEEPYMAIKYRADMLYKRKDYLPSSVTYTQLLSVLPKTHSLVRREAEDSLVRCWLALGRFEEALSKAEQLVLPPYERDVNAWLLLSRCHHHMGKTEERILALQSCASLQRYHHLHWVQLSSACQDLCNMFLKDVFQQPASYFGLDNQGTPLCSCGHYTTAKCLLPLRCATPLLHNMAKLFNPDHRRHDQVVDILRSVSHSQLPCSSSDYHVGECFNALDATPSSLKPFLQLVAGWTPADTVLSPMQLCLQCQLSQYATFSYASSYWCLLWAEFLLLRATKHAESFAKGVLMSELQEVQQRMRTYCWCASHVISQLFISANVCDGSGVD